MNDSFIILNANGDISTKNLREFLERSCVDQKMRLSSACSKFNFKVSNGIYSSIAENHLAFNRKVLGDIIKNENLSFDALRSITSIMSSDSLYSLKVHNIEALENRDKLVNMKPLDMSDFMGIFYNYLGEAIPHLTFNCINYVDTIRKRTLCVTDRFYISLILINFIHNAIVHSRSADNRVDIILGKLKRGKMISVSVVDYGIGVDLDYLMTCIESGVVRYGESQANIYRNKAFGLLTSVKLAEKIGGEIVAANHNEGAIFTLLLDASKCKCGDNLLSDPYADDDKTVRKMILSIMSYLDKLPNTYKKEN